MQHSLYAWLHHAILWLNSHKICRCDGEFSATLNVKAKPAVFLHTSFPFFAQNDLLQQRLCFKSLGYLYYLRG